MSENNTDDTRPHKVLRGRMFPLMFYKTHLLNFPKLENGGGGGGGGGGRASLNLFNSEIV